MSGHNKWSKIKRDKAITDARKSQTFSKISRAITIAAKEGGGEIDTNPSLRLAVEKSKEAGMPRDNVQRAIDKGLGVTADGRTMEEVVYEGYGPAGVAFLVRAVTDNKYRTVSEIRNLFTKSGGSMGASGRTAYIFADPENPSFTIPLKDGDLVKVENLHDELASQEDVSEVFSNYEARQ
ncbi:MAG: YebC/PmpR family DNA-binding transcriptional regulator [Patescibacteria group bacterium]|jgi:YebC/PmpR family DNA-binding regulatory protein